MKQVVVIAGPTGSGESTITNEIVKRFPRKIARLVTATTRPPRTGEVDGVDYYFFSEKEFEEQEKNGAILESTHIKNRNIHYGSYAPDLEKKINGGRIVIVNPDLVGARYYKEKYNATTIFIVPESLNALEARIRERSPELDEVEIAHRRENAAREMRIERPFYDHVVTNADGKLTDAVEKTIAILKKEGYTLE